MIRTASIPRLPSPTVRKHPPTIRRKFRSRNAHPPSAFSPGKACAPEVETKMKGLPVGHALALMHPERNMGMRYNIRAITLFVSLLSGLSCRAQPPAPPPPPPPPGPSAFVPPPPPPPPRGRRGPLSAPGEQGSRTTVSGVVRSFNYGPGGLDDLVLDQGTVIHFPLEYSSQVSAAAPVGSAVAASGWSHIGPAGDTLFDADTITNQRSSASIAMAAGPPPPGIGGAGSLESGSTINRQP